ncbi:chromate transporter [Mycoplasma zalophidermidis]|uniref:Chromate transporter n=2 Tax=Mycoplasma zalophidermidis TaxID=398174 RepID=A0ABS6DQW9_9MOLU|nr:chromate transporter [Mycoplasma zalophidermidis]MBU4693371.1 chromate transporter [Mycoplasma zalophidermidis]
MMGLLALLVSLPLIILVSLSVFGGGQIFMPIFTWLWKSLAKWFNITITTEQINSVFAISNSTPGILSPKFATVTGYLVSEGQWWGYTAMILTYLAFCVPPILMMKLAMKYADKFEDSLFLKKLINIMNPVVTGIIVALAIQLFIGLIAPQVVFNKSAKEYFGLDYSDKTVIFFSGWRGIVLYVYVPIGIIISLILYFKKIPMFELILGNVVIALILFEPWLKVAS